MTEPQVPHLKAEITRLKAVIAAMQNPTPAMIEAAAATPGMKAASDAMTLHQARGYGFDADAFKDGSPLHQACRAMVAAALREATQTGGESHD